MEIVSFTTLKNEADIIESFVRYNVNIFDKMVISDNLSTDGSFEILKKLEKEGLNIEVLSDESETFDEQTAKNSLLNYVRKKYNPDVIVPIDADEFIATDDDCNPRELMENIIEQDSLYLIEMVNFVVTEKDKALNENQSLFIPSVINHVRIESKEKKLFYKCIIPKGIYSKNNNGRNLDLGSHNYTNDNGTRPKTIIEKKIYIAHYPMRTVNKYIYKAIHHSIHNLRLFSSDSGAGYHLFYIYDEVMKNGTLPEKDFYYFSKYYDEINNPDKSKLINGLKEKKLNTSFCKNIKIKYTCLIDDKMIIKEALTSSKTIIDKMRNDIIDINKKKDSEIKKCIKEIESRGKMIESLNKEIIQQRKLYDEIVNSKRWKIINKIFKIFGK